LVRPDYVVMPKLRKSANPTPRADTEEWGTSSVSALSELGISSRPRNRSLFSDASISSSRRRGRLKPFSRKGSGPRSVSSRGSSKRRPFHRQGSDFSIRAAMSEELPTLFSPKCGEDSDTVSLGVQSFSPDLDRTKARDFHQKLVHSVSSPHLQVLPPVPLSGPITSMPVGNASSGEVVIRDGSPDSSIQKPNSLDILVGLDENESLPQPVALDRLEFRDDESDISQEEVMLERALMAFSSIKPIRLPWASSNEDIDTSLEYVAFVRWQQLDANLKHREVVKYLTEGHTSPQVIFHQSESDDWESACSSTGKIKQHLDKLELFGVVLGGDQAEANTSNPQVCGLKCDDASNPLPCFLSEIGALVTSSSPMHPADILLRHETASVSKTIDDLICIAKSDLNSFSSLIQRLAAFAAQNETSPDDNFDQTNFSVGLKHYQAIEKKGRRKYGGDFLQVKDVLRGQIVFPDEGSLVCALVCLNRLHSGQNQVSDVDDGIQVDLVRLKNSFVTEAPDKGPSPAILPTGYGHILLNVRLKSGLLAGTFVSCFSLFHGRHATCH
jgi:hypothetical protein